MAIVFGEVFIDLTGYFFGQQFAEKTNNFISLLHFWMRSKDCYLKCPIISIKRGTTGTN